MQNTIGSHILIHYCKIINYTEKQINTRFSKKIVFFFVLFSEINHLSHLFFVLFQSIINS